MYNANNAKCNYRNYINLCNKYHFHWIIPLINMYYRLEPDLNMWFPNVVKTSKVSNSIQRCRISADGRYYKKYTQSN